jgi:hypothetical protein
MIWVQLILLLIAIGLLNQLNKLVRDINTTLKQMALDIQLLVQSSTSHQTSVAHRTTTRQVPGVDSRGRTTRRDTDDLPRSGRMGRISLSRRSTPPEESEE